MKKLVLCGVVSVLLSSNVVYADGVGEYDLAASYFNGGLISEEEAEKVQASQEKRILEDLSILPSENSSCIDSGLNLDTLNSGSTTNT